MAGELRHPHRARLASLGLAGLVRALRGSIRLRHLGDEAVRAWESSRTPFILAFWHRHLLLMRYAYRGNNIVVLISQSDDGELAARTMLRLGVDVARGSTSRGGASGLRELVRRARAGWDVGVTPDGPRGPAERVQAGTIYLAAATGLPIVPVALAADRAWVLRSWDRMVVPKPFARVVLAYGEAQRVGRDEDPAAAAADLERRLARVGELAAEAVAAERRGARA